MMSSPLMSQTEPRGAFLIELKDEDMAMSGSSNSSDPEGTDMPTDGDSSDQDTLSEINGGNKRSMPTADMEPDVNLFTCYVGPCPEMINTGFKHPEFMICYRDANTRCENSMMRYYCCPMYLAKVEKNGEETYELRAMTKQPQADVDQESREQQEREWCKYYSMQQPRMASSYEFQPMPPPLYSFMHTTCFPCPPPMMTFFTNYQCQMQPQPMFNPYGYHNYV